MAVTVDVLLSGELSMPHAYHARVRVRVQDPGAWSSLRRASETVAQP